MNHIVTHPNSHISQNTKNSLPLLTGEDGEPLSYVAHLKRCNTLWRNVTH